MTGSNLSPRNAGFGFFGTIAHHAEPIAAWPLALEAVGHATKCSAEAARDFLDSCHGRHFADDVANGLHAGLALKPAIDAAVTRWMGWRIDGRTERETGIPPGLPYLVGHVARFEMLAEIAD